MNSKKSIILIVCYYGKFPWYFQYFLHTCKFNPTITFYVFTNCKFKGNLPKNVRFIKYSLQDLIKLISKKTGFQIHLDFPYKLCDFRPAFGNIFSNYLSGYDFWGYCDIDIIFGQIRNFITDDLLNQYDVITPRHDYLLGALTLFKNIKKINNLYLLSKDVKKIMCSSKHYCFDETNFEYASFVNGLQPEDVKSEVESMTHVVKKLNREKNINAYFDYHIIDGTPGRLKWDHGILMYKNEFEAILYHLARFKNVYKPKKGTTIPNLFQISPTRIYT